MSRRKFEKPQTGNPHKLPLKQHVFPSASIARFADGNGFVSLQRLAAEKARNARPSDVIFCARRAWDTRAERGYMKKFEDEFQELASRILSGAVTNIGKTDKYKVDQFFGLWKWRAEFRNKDISDIQLKGVTGEKFSKDQEEQFEKRGILYVREGGVMSAHRLHGVQIQAAIIHETRALSNINWGIIQAREGQFVVPDFPTITYVPLLPTVCLCGGLAGRGDIVKDNVININLHLKAGCKEYYFANDLGQCF